MTIPFIKNNCVIFECHSGKICVGDLANEAAVYDLPFRGICHIPAEAIKVASGIENGAFSVDNAQFFIIDADLYETVREDLLANGIVVPNVALLENIRERHKTSFGYLVSGEFHDCEFEGDGTYLIEVTLINQGLPTLFQDEALDAKERLRRIISSMNTLVCAKCFSEEIQSHPKLGMSPSGRGKKKKEWAIAMAEYALTHGWIATSERGSFGDITPLCPKCKETQS